MYGSINVVNQDIAPSVYILPPNMLIMVSISLPDRSSHGQQHADVDSQA